MKDLVDKSMEIVTHIGETLTRIKPTEPLRLVKREARKKRNCSDSRQLLNFFFVYLQQNKKGRKPECKKMLH